MLLNSTGFTVVIIISVVQSAILRCVLLLLQGNFHF